MFAINRNLYAYVKITNREYTRVTTFHGHVGSYILILWIFSELLRKQGLLERNVERTRLRRPGRSYIVS